MGVGILKKRNNNIIVTLSKATKMSSHIVLMIAGIIRMRVIKGGPHMRKYGTYCQLGFSSVIEVAQLDSAWLGTFIARLGLSWKILARTLLGIL